MTDNEQGRRPSGPPPSSFRYVSPVPDEVAVLARPEPRDRYFPWLIAGFFFWPLLLVAAEYYFKDRKSYELAMEQYRRGVDPEWYWQGLRFPEDV